MMTDDMQERIKKLLEVDSSEYFTINNSKFECHFLKMDGKLFSEWEKDNNSPSFFCEAKVVVYMVNKNASAYDGLVLVQRNDAAISPLSAALYIKEHNASEWQSMHNIVDIIFS